MWRPTSKKLPHTAAQPTAPASKNHSSRVEVREGCSPGASVAAVAVHLRQVTPDPTDPTNRTNSHQEEHGLWSVLILQFFGEEVCEVVFPQPVVLRVVSKERRETLVLQHQATIRRARSDADDRPLGALQDQVFRRL